MERCGEAGGLIHSRRLRQDLRKDWTPDMPAKWQQWMPLHIDKWRGSPAVRAMHPAARSGYLDLILSQWQSDDCTLPSDPLNLAELSCLGDELWTVYGARIMRNFVTVDGRLRNLVCFEEWQEAKRVFEARKKSADQTNRARWGIGDRPGDRSVTDYGVFTTNSATSSVTDTNSSVTDTNSSVTDTITESEPNRRAHTITGTVTLTEEPTTSARSVPPEEPAATLPLVDGSSYPVSREQIDDWALAFPGIDVTTEIKRARVWFDANPTRKKTRKGINRSLVNWLGRAQDSSRGGNGPPGPVTPKPKTRYEMEWESQQEERRKALRETP